MKKRATKKDGKRKRQSKRARRQKLEKATAAYYASLSGEALEEENRIGAAMAYGSSQVNFDE